MGFMSVELLLIFDFLVWCSNIIFLRGLKLIMVRIFGFIIGYGFWWDCVKIMY